ANGYLFVCGGVRNVMIDYFAWPLTYGPFWAKYDANLQRVFKKATDPRKPGDQTRDGLGYGDQFNILSAIAVSPAGDVYVGGYGIEWGNRYNPSGSSDAVGYIGRYRLQPDGRYGDTNDIPNDFT